MNLYINQLRNMERKIFSGEEELEETEDDGSHKDIEEYQRERETEQAEAHYHPSEG